MRAYVIFVYRFCASIAFAIRFFHFRRRINTLFWNVSRRPRRCGNSISPRKRQTNLMKLNFFLLFRGGNWDSCNGTSLKHYTESSHLAQSLPPFYKCMCACKAISIIVLIVNQFRTLCDLLENKFAHMLLERRVLYPYTAELRFLCRGENDRDVIYWYCRFLIVRFIMWHCMLTFYPRTKKKETIFKRERQTLSRQPCATTFKRNQHRRHQFIHE